MQLGKKFINHEMFVPFFFYSTPKPEAFNFIRLVQFVFLFYILLHLDLTATLS